MWIMNQEKQQEMFDRIVASIGEYSNKQVNVSLYGSDAVVIQSPLLTSVDLDSLFVEFENYMLVPEGLVVCDYD
jgi:hypothetical protein